MKEPWQLVPGARADKRSLGQAAEDQACAYLMRQGLTALERNFRCRGGEIDLIMQQREVLVFVEVRQRADKRHGGAAASVTAAKQARLIVAAQVFLQRYRTPPACRFDVIAIEGNTLEWLRNAFDA